MAGEGEGQGQGEKVGALQAAIQAGAEYVWTTSYQEGGECGWASGWTAGWEAGTKALAKHTQRESTTPEAVTTEGEADAESGAAESRLEMNEEWIKLFKRGEQLRKKQRMEDAVNKHDKTHDMIDDMYSIALGGKCDEERRARARVLYGSGAESILEIEASMDAQFQSIVARSGAQFWPVV